MNAFSNLPAICNRGFVSGKLRAIRKFRNRINHNEPIVLYRNAIDFSSATEIHQSIIEVLNWLDPQLIGWIAELDKISQTLARCRKI